MRWRFGNFALTHTPKPLTANRAIQWSDNSGTVELESFYQNAVTNIVPLNRKTVMAPLTVTGPYPFAPSPTGDVVGGTCQYWLVSNGVNMPTFAAGLTESSESSGYDGRVGIINVIKFWADGIFKWYSISQPVGQQPTWFNVGLTFPVRAADTITQSGETYYSNTTNIFNAWMRSAQAIPANKAGRLVVRTDSDQIIGFTTATTAVGYASMQYYAWLSSSFGSVFTGADGGANVQGPASPLSDVFIRLTRSSAGVVTAEFSIDSLSWTLYRTFANTNTSMLYVNANLTGTINATRQMDIISFEVEA